MDDKPEDHSRRAHRDRVALILAILTLIGTFAGIWVQLMAVDEQLAQQERISSAQYVLDMRDRLDSPAYAAITTAIEGNPHTYSPLSDGFSNTTLENYMGELETIGDLQRDNVITQRMAYDEFSYDVEKAYCNADIQNDIAQDRQEAGVSTGTDALWSGFQYMATGFLTMDGYPCSSTILDNE